MVELPVMPIDALIDQLAADGPLLAGAAGRAGWDAAVPGTRWEVRALVTHVGGVHRWATDIVATGGHSLGTEAGAAVGTGPDDAELCEWFLAGHTALVETLRAAPADLDCATFLPADSPLAFWARRQAHETAVHRADAERAGGEATPCPAGFAQDGIAELLLGFAARRSSAIPTPGTVRLSASDGPSWLVRFGGERIQAQPGDGPGAADATVSGSSSELYTWLWNRPSGARVDGDATIADLWHDVRVRWS